MNLKVSYNKTLWKELFMGMLEGCLWCAVLFLAIYGFNTEIVDLLQFLADNYDKGWSIFFSVLPIFIVIGMLFKLGAFVLKFDDSEAKATRKTTRKTTKKKTTK